MNPHLLRPNGALVHEATEVLELGEQFLEQVKITRI